VPFAGHPTIGTGNYLLNHLEADIETLITKAGPIPISTSQAGGVQAEIPFAFHVHQNTAYSVLNGEQNPIVSIVKGMSFILVKVPSLDVLAEADLNVVGKGNVNGYTYDTSCLDASWNVGLCCTMYYCFRGISATGQRKYRTRMFGTREDPGTGSASSGLATFLALKEGGEGREASFAFEQGVEMGKKNEIAVVVETDGLGEIKKVLLSGQAVKVMEGSLEL
jgi:PhzF family phenazine biosynthesis protein